MDRIKKIINYITWAMIAVTGILFLQTGIIFRNLLLRILAWESPMGAEII